MAVTVLEKFESRQSTTGENAQIDLEYVVSGTDDDVEAKAGLLAGSPAIYDGLIRQNVQIDPVGPQLWDGKVHYGLTDHQPIPQTGESTFSFETSGGTQRITQSLGTVGKYAPSGGTAPDFQGAVGVTHDNVEGVDITVPVYQFAETHYLPASAVTNEYKGTLFRLTGKVNSGGFRGLNAGECLFLGASGSQRGTEDWEITFRFAGSPNVTNLHIGDITVASKKGWEYLWVRYEDAEDTDAQTIVKRPTAAYVEKVYEEADFGALCIGS